MAGLQKAFDGGDANGNSEPGFNGLSHSTSTVVPPLTAAAPLVAQDVLEEDTGSILVVNQQQELFHGTKTRGERFGYPFYAFALSALLLSIFLARRLYLAAGREKPVHPYPVPTDNEGLRMALEAVEESSKMLQNKLKGASKEVRAAFTTQFCPVVGTRPLTWEQFRHWCNAYANTVKSQPIPKETASKAERQEFVLGCILVTTVFRVAAKRLDLLSKLEDLSLKHQIPPALYASPERALSLPIWEDKGAAVSFQTFTERLETLGVVEAAKQGDSATTVSLLLANDLANVTSVKKLYDVSNLDVVNEFQAFLESVKAAEIGSSDEERSRIESINMPGLALPVPVRVLAEAVKCAKLSRESEHLPISGILSLRTRWNEATVSSVSMDVRAMLEGMVYHGLDIRRFGLEKWGYMHDYDARTQHIFSYAIFLL
ncbi:hypothetical protein EAH_00027460 [Eimeria acervulina]|uniref:Uncharacterized protein n=1 Tax=Eimeria acervulina TaxID=5801 RepID=U6GQ90_EIMAC|nr:hypothetical protein EAH_00027460 [Eimeria acervulina]CDI82360.1 hypothetical protein EAH_00027460 [Eimeria acervulina]